MAQIPRQWPLAPGPEARASRGEVCPVPTPCLLAGCGGCDTHSAGWGMLRSLLPAASGRFILLLHKLTKDTPPRQVLEMPPATVFIASAQYLGWSPKTFLQEILGTSLKWGFFHVHAVFRGLHSLLSDLNRQLTFCIKLGCCVICKVHQLSK